MTPETFDTPMGVCVCNGEIVIIGPDGLSAAFTVDAARRSAEALLQAVHELGGDEVYQKPLG